MKLQGLFAIFAVATISAAAGCAGQPDTGAPTAAESSTAMPAAASHGAATGASQLVSGTVLETMDAAGYTYVRVDTGDAEIWAASNRFEVAVGDRVTLPLETPMEGFHSASLDRDFDRIYFASFIVQEGEVPAAPPQGGAGELPPGHPPLDAFKVEPGAAAAAINAPSGGVTIADVWRHKADLSGTTVTVRGRVVKYNAGILGRNWLHLQDGSGELAAGTNDLTVTTTGTVAVGDVVTATGTVATDRDFGAGYTYTVMIEDAAVTAQ